MTLGIMSVSMDVKEYFPSSNWYISKKDIDQRQAIPLAKELFREAQTRFTQDLVGENRQRNFAKSSSNIEEIQQVISTAKNAYEKSRGNGKIRERLEAVSKRLKHYENVLNALVQHHPEYVSLAWGAMKFLFMAFLNHENTISTLSKAVSSIADALPRVELATILYPTPRMEEAVVELYAYIIRFFIRAYDWYNDGSFRHVIHAITRPAEIRYKDLLDQISHCSDVIHKLSMAGSQAEQRDMHSKLDSILVKFNSLESVTSGGFLNTNQRLSDLQLSQVIGHLSTVPLEDTIKIYQRALFMRNRRARRFYLPRTDPFWLSPKLQSWSSSPDSAVTFLKGTFRSRFDLKDACVGMIEQLRNAGIPVMWLMRESLTGGETPRTSSTDLLKSLVSQLLKMQTDIYTEKMMALTCARFHSAITEEEWFQILGSVMSEFTKDLYIFIDLDLLDSTLSAASEGFSWPLSFMSLFARLGGERFAKRVKVLLFSHRSTVPFVDEDSQDVADLTVAIKSPLPISMRRKMNARRRRTPGSVRKRGGNNEI